MGAGQDPFGATRMTYAGHVTGFDYSDFVIDHETMRRTNAGGNGMEKFEFFYDGGRLLVHN